MQTVPTPAWSNVPAKVLLGGDSICGPSTPRVVDGAQLLAEKD